MTTARTGFLARGSSMLGPLTVSRGYGSITEEVIVFPVDPLTGFQEGAGLETILRAQVLDGPKTILRFPELADEEEEGGTIIAAAPASAPKLTGEGGAPEEESPGTSVKAEVKRGPKVIIRKG